jgi:hypothetical protein
MSEIIISLTTTSFRIHTLYLTIKSLIKQNTHYNYSIRIYISKEEYLLDEGITKVPNNLLNVINKNKNKKIEIYETPNIGSFRKLLPLLKEKKKEDCIIITVDDDKIYKDNLVNTLVNNFLRYNGKHIIAHRASLKINKYLIKYYIDSIESIDSKILSIIENNLNNKKISQNICNKLGSQYEFIRYLTFFEGNDGVLYHTKFFDNRVFNINLIENYARTHDDFWFKICSLLNNIGTICISSFENRSGSQIKSLQKISLSNKLNKGTYKNDLNYLCQHILI